MSTSFERLKNAIAARYEIERELGHGAMATVYLARDLKHNREVAVKVLLADVGFALGPERFRREIDLASHLSHPHILPIYDSGEADGELYYVMPFVAGESLRARLNRERQLPLDEALRIACEVASALDHSHRHGIIHRDIKPENILLEDGQALVADFGIARAVSAMGEEKLTATGVSLGTPTYMSPEQGMADPNLDGRTDIYSLGCVLYEMLAGQPPFTGRTTQALIARHSLDEVPSISIVRRTIPEEVEDAILTALAKAPADRFSTAGAFAEALQACQQTGARTVRRTGRRTASRKRVKQKSWGAIAAVVTLAVLVLAGAAWAGKSFLQGRAAFANVGIAEYRPQRVAVLYFKDLTPDKRLGYLADGLTEALADELNQVSALDVISTGGISQFRGKDVTPDSIARALEAGTLVDGSVDADGDRIRATLRLVDGNSGAERDRVSIVEASGNSLVLRTKLAEQLALMLREWLGNEIRLRALRSGTASPNAWSLVQRAERARKDADSLSSAGAGAAASTTLVRADSLLAAAERLDGRWAKVPVLRATAVYARAKQPGLNPAALSSLIDSGVMLADRALKVQPNNPDAFQIKGELEFFRYVKRVDTDPNTIDRLLPAAESDLTRAVDLNRDQADAWVALSSLYYAKPDIQAANVAALNAYRADAYLSSARQVLKRLWSTSHDLEQYPEALKWCNEGRRRFPTDPFFTTCRLWMYTTRLERPDIDSVWSYRNKYVALLPAQQQSYGQRFGDVLAAGALARAGLADSARSVLMRARATPAEDPTRELEGTEAVVRVILGDHDEAIRLIADYLAVNPGHRKGFATRISPWWRDLQSNPKFQRLMAGAR